CGAVGLMRLVFGAPPRAVVLSRASPPGFVPVVVREWGPRSARVDPSPILGGHTIRTPFRTLECGRIMHHKASPPTGHVAHSRSLAYLCTALAALLPGTALAQAEPGKVEVHAGGEASLVLPPLDGVHMLGFSGSTLLTYGLVLSLFGAVFGIITLNQVRALPVHASMANVSNIIWETCKTYLLRQGKFLLLLEVFIGAIMVVYFGVLEGLEVTKVLIILAFSLVGIAGS